jgi:hypothetical protein
MPPISDASPAFAAAQHGAVLCDLAPLAVLAVAGPDAPSFLQGQLSNDAVGLPADGCQYTSYNSPGGRMLANPVLWRAGPDAGGGYRALLPADIAEPVKKRLAMYVLRSKVTLADATPGLARLGVGGPDAPAAVAAAFGGAPAPFAVLRAGTADVLALPGPRFVVVAPAADGTGIAAALAARAVPAPFPVWQWLAIRAGVPVVTAPVQDRFVAQTANWDVLGGVNFHKGCYTGQEIIARMHYLGRLKERLFAFHGPEATVAAGARLYSSAFGDQPCGTVVNAAPAPGGGCDLLAVLQIAAAAGGDVHLDAPDGPRLAPMPLPYEVPPPAEPRGRNAPRPAGP